MFDETEFEKKLYRMVTAEVNDVFVKLMKDDDEAVQGNGVRIQLCVAKALHLVIEETVMQISYGLNVYQRCQDVKRAKNGKKKPVLKPASTPN